MKINIITILLISFAFFQEASDVDKFSISRIHYQGGGDWYSDPSSLPNLLNFISKNTLIEVQKKENQVKIGDDIFNISDYLYITGHGNIKLTKKEIATLRNHLLNGAFLHADDNYGMDKSFRKMIYEMFPDKEFIELPYNHEIFNCFYKFNNGLPKIHEHDNKAPQALGIFHEDRLIILYTYESDLGDGWENSNVHNVSNKKRQDALKMGANIIIYSIIN